MQPSQEAAVVGSPGELDLADMRRRVAAIFVGSIGNLVEWYDFYAYSAFALYFASAFFPGSDPVVQQLNAAILFAIGFIVRPVGGWLFGHLADAYGRRQSLMASVLLMCFGSLMIAATPSYASIGIAAPVMLGFARLLQGLSLGGEYGTSATYLSEVADPKRRGFYSSFQYVTLIGGQLTALLVLMLLQRVFLTADQLRAWGWRIPFFIGALLALVALAMRRNLHETDDFRSASKVVRRESSLKALLRYPKEVLVVVGLTMGGTTAFYTYTTYMQKYLVLSVGMDKKVASTVMTAALFVYMCMQPLFGALSDRIGRKTSMLWFGILGTLCTWPILSALKGVQSPYAAFGLIILAMAIVSLYTSIGGLIKAEMFPPEIRALGVGLSYAIGNAIFGGSAEYVALSLKTSGFESAFYVYVSVMCFFAFLVCFLIPDLRKHGHLNEVH